MLRTSDILTATCNIFFRQKLHCKLQGQIASCDMALSHCFCNRPMDFRIPSGCWIQAWTHTSSTSLCNALFQIWIMAITKNTCVFCLAQTKEPYVDKRTWCVRGWIPILLRCGLLYWKCGLKIIIFYTFSEFKLRLQTAINRADFVSWWMWFNGSPTKAQRHFLTNAFCYLRTYI